MSQSVSEKINIHFDNVKRLEAINNLDLCPLSDRETNSFYGKSDGCFKEMHIYVAVHTIKTEAGEFITRELVSGLISRSFFHLKAFVIIYVSRPLQRPKSPVDFFGFYFLPNYLKCL